MLQLIYIALPAFVANMLPVFATHWDIFPTLAHPIDERRFGVNKTWRGLVVGVIGAIAIASAQWLIFSPYPTVMHAFLFGALAGSGALGGDLIKSFFKRLFGIENGRPFVPFDQIDYMLGFLLFTYPLATWSFADALFLLVFALIANPVVNGLAYAIGLKKTFW